MACPKAENGERDIPINELTRPILENAIANRHPSKEDLLFCKPDGTLYTDNVLNSYFKRIFEKAGIKSRTHNHRLRKNSNTRGVEVDIDYKVLEENVGYGDLNILLNTYVDAQKDFKEKNCKNMLNMLKCN